LACKHLTSLEALTIKDCPELCRKCEESQEGEGSLIIKDIEPRNKESPSIPKNIEEDPQEGEGSLIINDDRPYLG